MQVCSYIAIVTILWNVSYIKHLIFLSMWWLNSSSEEYRAKLKRLSLRLRDERSVQYTISSYLRVSHSWKDRSGRRVVYKNNLPKTRSPRLILSREIRGCFLCVSRFSLRRSSPQSFVALTWEVVDFLTLHLSVFTMFTRKIYAVVAISDLQLVICILIFYHSK